MRTNVFEMVHGPRTAKLDPAHGQMALASLPCAIGCVQDQSAFFCRPHLPFANNWKNPINQTSRISVQKWHLFSRKRAEKAYYFDFPPKDPLPFCPGTRLLLGVLPAPARIHGRRADAGAAVRQSAKQASRSPPAQTGIPVSGPGPAPT